MTFMSELRAEAIRKSILLMAGLCAVVVTTGYCILMFQDPEQCDTRLAVLEMFVVFLSTMYNAILFITKHLKLGHLHSEAKANLGSLPILFNAILGMSLVVLRVFDAISTRRISVGTIVGLAFGLTIIALSIKRWKEWSNALHHISTYRAKR